MSIIKCKACGGDLQLLEEANLARCEYCDIVQTIPTMDDEKKLIQFERAERLRKQCEFDKAAGIYETIVADFRQEAEAYWGLVLCKYGIEYVDDPTTGKKVPTCHRSSFDSIMEDSDFEQALENADVMARKVYRDEAKQIEEIRKGIIAVSAKEEPYDIFICYKETAPNGDRTLDSVLAQDVYDALTGKGYRVFFSRISLEDKLGQEYEPYIFAALNSARIMLVFGTDYEYFNAVWVKNEWSRFLKLMAKDKEKHLIPCYKDIDAYDMPKEFAKLQAQDLGKVGAIQDLLRGVDKILPRQAETENATASSGTVNPTIDSYLKRVFMFLEDEDWRSANDYCEKVLDIDPENSRAYLGKLMAELKVNKQEQLQHVSVSFTENKHYQKLLRFANDNLRSTIEQYALAVQERLATEKALLETMRKVEQKQLEAEHKAEQERLEAERKARQERLEAERKAEQERLEAARKAEQERLEAERKAEQERLEAERKAEQERLEAERKAEQERQEAARKKYEENKIRLKPIREKYAAAAGLIAAGTIHSVAVLADGTAVATGSNIDRQCNVGRWRDIVAISANDSTTIGLRADGTVVAAGYNGHCQCNVSSFYNIVAISTGGNHTLGLRANGTVVAAGDNREGQCNVGAWKNIVAICAGSLDSFGIRADGTVVTTGHNNFQVEDWTDIVAVSAGHTFAIGLRADGTVVTTGSCNFDLSGWTDIVAISTNINHAIGLRADGTAVAAGKNDEGQCAVSGHRRTNLVAVCTGGSHTLLLHKTGDVDMIGSGKWGQCSAFWRLFENYDNLTEERRIGRGLCRHCGGELKGLFSKKCVNCDKPKDY